MNLQNQRERLYIIADKFQYENNKTRDLLKILNPQVLPLQQNKDDKPQEGLLGEMQYIISYLENQIYDKQSLNTELEGMILNLVEVSPEIGYAKQEVCYDDAPTAVYKR